MAFYRHCTETAVGYIPAAITFPQHYNFLSTALCAY